MIRGDSSSKDAEALLTGWWVLGLPRRAGALAVRKVW